MQIILQMVGKCDKINFDKGKTMVKKKGIYKHFKGNLYMVEDVALHSETCEEMVVYRALYGEHGLWVRPLAMFEESVQVDGKLVKRFALVESEQ